MMVLYRRSIPVFLLSVVTMLTGFSQQATVSGVIYDSGTREPLSGVHVVYGDNQGTISLPDGSFSFETTPGILTISFQYLGYHKHEQAVEIKSGEGLNLQINLEPSFSEIDEIVVSPSKSEQKISELNVSTLLIKPAQLEENHILKPEEIINQAQGIEVMDGQASIRGGSGYAYGVGSRVLVLIDGYPTLAADAGNIKWGFLPLDNLSGIEIIKGASSVLYGSSALNGVINFRTREATTKASTRFSLTTGIFDKPSNKNWVWWDSPRVFTNASFSYSQRHKNTGIGLGGRFLYDNSYRRLNDDKLGNLNLKIKQHAEKVKGLQYGVQLNSGYQERIDFLLWEDADTGALRQNEETASRLKTFMLTFDPYISYDRGGKFRHDLRMRYQATRNRMPENSNNNSDANTVFTEYQLSWNIVSKLDLIAGAAGTFNRIISPFHGNHTWINLAGYTQVDYQPWTRLKLQGGLRIEHYQLDQENDEITPIFRLGANYQAARFTFLRASFGQGYRYPSIAERFATTTLGSIRIFPNPDILPESGWSAEIGVKQGISFKEIIGQADLSFFYTRNTDLIEYIFGIYTDPETHEGAYGFRASNTEFSRVYGFEVETSLNRNFGLVSTGLCAGYTFMYPAEYDPIAKQNTGEYLKYRRSHAINITTSTAIQKFELGLNFYYRSKILNIDDVFLDPLTREELLPGFYEYWMQNNQEYMLLDVFLTWHISKKYALSFGIKNLTNTEYMGRPGDIRPQRSYSLQFRGRF